MSLLFFDSFKNYTTLPMKWEDCTDRCRAYITDGIGRKGGQALRFYSNDTIQGYDHLGKHIGEQEEVIVGFAFKKLVNDVGFIEIDFVTEETIQSSIRLFNESFAWLNHDNSLNYGLGASLKFNDWNYFEAKVKTHTTSGTIDVRINDLPVLSMGNLESSTGTNYIDKVRFRLRQQFDTNEDYAYIEDLYIANVSGTVNNNFLGNCEISVAYPTSNGSYTNFLPSPTFSGTENYTIINEPEHVPDTTSYNEVLAVQHPDDDGYDSNYCSAADNFSISTTRSFVEYARVDRDDYFDAYIWFKIDNLSIPKNAKITNAHMEVVREYTSTNYANIHIHLQRSGVPVERITYHNEITSRSHTYNYVSVSANTNINGVDIAKPLQELVSRNDWQEVDNKVLVILRYYYDNSSNTNIYERYRFYNYSSSPVSSNTPKLNITWEVPSDDNGKYIATGDLAQKETYTVSGTFPEEVGDVLAINHNIFSKRDATLGNTNDMVFNTLTVEGGTTYTGTGGGPLEAQYGCINAITETNPATGTYWTTNDINNNEFGFTTISG